MSGSGTGTPVSSGSATLTESDLITLLTQEVKGLSSALETVDYTNAIDAAERDTGWLLPQSGALKKKWLIDRSKRHLFFFLLSEAAHKFRYKNIHLQHRFDHYIRMIEIMDASFEKAQEEYAYEFADVSAYQAMGTKVDAGFAYEPQTGRDHTFDDENLVLIHPNDNS